MDMGDFEELMATCSGSLVPGDDLGVSWGDLGGLEFLAQIFVRSYAFEGLMECS